MSSVSGRVLAVDLGDSRIGLALSDPLGITAQPLPVLDRVGPRKDLQRLGQLAREREVVTIVIGLPLLLDGAEGERCALSREFARTLAGHVGKCAIEFWDERLTTVEAERLLIEADVRRGRRRRLVDGLAATLILQSYLECRSSIAPDPVG